MPLSVAGRPRLWDISVSQTRLLIIVDFYCPKARLVVEVGGDTHADRLVYDLERTRWLEERKACRVMRFTNDEIHHNLPAVLEAIAVSLKRPPP